MKFETTPQLILSQDEFDTLNKAMKLCQDMDGQTSGADTACLMCPFQKNCSLMCKDCTYIQAYSALEAIIDIAIVKQGKPYFQFCVPLAGERGRNFLLYHISRFLSSIFHYFFKNIFSQNFYFF